MTENPTAGAGQPVPPTPAASTPPAGNVTDDNVGTGNAADAGTTDHNPTDSSSVSDDPAQDRSVAFEEKRQEELAEARQVHADRGSEPDAQQRLTAEHEGTGAGEEQPSQGNLEEVPDGTDNA